MPALPDDQLSYYIQFMHPEKMLAGLPGLSDANVAALFAIPLAEYQRIKEGFAANARRAAGELLQEPGFAAQVARLPLSAGDVVVGLGDSITDDYQSWLEILRHTLALARPGDNIKVVNAGISGDTTSQMLTRFLGVVLEKPNLIICMAGTNDARTHGPAPVKSLVSIEETARNYAALRHYAATSTGARWVWMTPCSVIEPAIAVHWRLGAYEMAWPQAALDAVAAAIRAQPEPVVDLQAVFGTPANPALLMDDGLHPCLEGQKAILRALVEKLAG